MSQNQIPIDYGDENDEYDDDENGNNFNAYDDDNAQNLKLSWLYCHNIPLLSTITWWKKEPNQPCRGPPPKKDNARLKKFPMDPPFVKKKVLSDESRSRDKVILKS